MADSEIAGLTEDTTPAQTDNLYVQDAAGAVDKRVPISSLATVETTAELWHIPIRDHTGAVVGGIGHSDDFGPGVVMWLGDSSTPSDYDGPMLGVFADGNFYLQNASGAANIVTDGNDLTVTAGSNLVLLSSDVVTISSGTAIKFFNGAGVNGTGTPSTLVGLADMLVSLGVIASHTVTNPQPLDADLTDIAAIADAQGDIIVRGAAGWERLAKSATSTHVLTAGASQPAWAAPAGGGSSGLTPLNNNTTRHRNVAPGCIRNSFAQPLFTLAANTTYYMGPYEHSGLSISGGIINVQAVTGTANVRLAVIAMNTTTWQPSSVALDLGANAYTTTGQKTVSTSATSIAAGAYFVGVRTDNATLALTGGRVQPVSGWRGSESLYSNASAYTVAEAYGAWAGTPTAWTTVVYHDTATAATGMYHVMDWLVT